jgi:hypothetical protein
MMILVIIKCVIHLWHKLWNIVKYAFIQSFDDFIWFVPATARSLASSKPHILKLCLIFLTTMPSAVLRRSRSWTKSSVLLCSILSCAIVASNAHPRQHLHAGDINTDIDQVCDGSGRGFWSVLTPGLDNDWWKSTTMYHIYPRSFKDTDGDGIGDLQGDIIWLRVCKGSSESICFFYANSWTAGIITELDYLANLGIETIWLSPVYKSPMADFGYDISDFRDVDPLFGTLDDLRQLVDGIHVRGNIQRITIERKSRFYS